MQALDQQTLIDALEWLENTNPWLCTIVKTTGSSPRPVGSIMVLAEDGRQSGSISGGCIEEDLVEQLKSGSLTTVRPQIIEYGINAEENERLGLPCGGRLSILLQRLTATDQSWLLGVLTALEERKCVQRSLDFATGSTAVETVLRFSPLQLTDKHMLHCFGPRMRMLLVGAGQLAQSLAELGQAMEYEIIVTDPREQFLRQWQGPAVELIHGMPDDVVRRHASDQHSAIITLTHDPRIDDMALMEALESDAWYVGALGSKRTTEKRLQRLRQLDIPESRVARLHAPVGLPIGSKTPIEIAVAIMAELTQLRRTAANS